tara:strand:+ start:844 stop:1374 length:531 start_codon:yes stop_codon:yes gene_type:complete
MANKPKLTIEVHDSAVCTLLYNQPITGSNKYGDYNMYTFDVEGTQMVHYASDNAHETLKNCKEGDVVNIEHKKKSDGGSVYIVDLIGQGDVPSKNKQNQKPNDTDMAIKWGMAFNNATRLVANINTGQDIVERVGLIKDIMPKMFEIACSMPINEKPEVPKPEELKKEEGDDDLPF